MLIAVLGDDPTLPAEPARASVRYCRSARVVEIPGVGHWVARQAPERTTELILEFVHSVEARR